MADTKALNAVELRGLSGKELNDQVLALKEELFNLRFQSATGQLDSHGRLRAVKRDIARIYTEMRERELGISAPPAPAPVAPAKADKKADKAEKKAKA